MAGPIQLSSSLRTQVHLWTVELEASSSTLEQFFSILSEDERARAERFAFQDLRESFVICRGVLRNLVGTYLSLAPQDLAFYTNPQGKPYVASKNNLFQFNLAHSGKLAVYAFAFGCELGVDVEKVVDLPDLSGLAKSFFCPEEWEELENLSEGRQRTHGFFSCWTRKEAYLKAKGTGLLLPLDSFRVSVKSDERPRLIHIDRDPAEAAHWSVYHFLPHPNHIGAAVFRGTRPIRMFPFAAAENMSRCLNE